MNILNIFYRPSYRSETTLFIEQLKAAKPEIDAGQRNGMAILWDKIVDRQAWAGHRAARVAQQPYVYQTLSQS